MKDHRGIARWRGVSDEQWTDWRWQLQNAITTLPDLENVLNLSEEERKGVRLATKHLKMRISPHIVSLMHPDNSDDPLRRQFIPSAREIESMEDVRLFVDVNADDDFSPLTGLVHRYPSKVLIFPTNYCGSYCRYCFRRKMAREVESSLSRSELENIEEYLREHSGIEEVILSGGDPLVLGDSAIESLLNRLAAIPHLRIVRFHTRIPITVPYRVTEEFIALLQEYRKRFALYFVLHVDTGGELSEPMRHRIGRLIDAGIPCLASSPLLRGVNDSADTLRELWTSLVEMRVKPYYLFHSDPVQGLRHFVVPLARGMQLMYQIYDRMSGLAMPHYCFNVPGGGGHVLVGYNYISRIDDVHYRITTFDGKQVDFVDSAEP